MRRHARIVAIAAAVAAIVAAAPADLGAHVTSTGLAVIEVDESAVTYRLTVIPAELPDDFARSLTAAADADPASIARVAAALRERVHIDAGATPCRPGRASIQGSNLADTRVTLELVLRCSAATTTVVIRDDWFDVFGPHYRTLARIERRGVVRDVALLPDARSTTVELAAPGSAGGSFFRLGLEHILTGYDHLLFLAALLLRGGTVISLLKIVTSFTVAHSVTLAIAVLGVVAIPDRLVESAIAASIAWVAAENVLARDASSRRWAVSFAFGLVHGFGFAGTLAPLTLPRWNLALALFGFNAGIEAGQSAVVLVALPGLLAIRRRGWEPALVRVASLALIGIGVVWFVERLFS